MRHSYAYASVFFLFPCALRTQLAFSSAWYIYSRGEKKVKKPKLHMNMFVVFSKFYINALKIQLLTETTNYTNIFQSALNLS